MPLESAQGDAPSMKALTLYQPLAGKIFTLDKRIETRS